jgi:putative ABC transport system ATP-binding protein
MRRLILQRAATSRSLAPISPGLPCRSRANDPLLAISCNLQRPFSHQTRRNLPSTLLQSATRSKSSTEKIRRRRNDSLYPNFFNSKAPASTSARTVTEEPKKLKDTDAKNTEHNEDLIDDEEFGRSERAGQAAQLNLQAKLSKDGSAKTKGLASREVWRLLKIAGPEMKTLSGAFSLLLVSSAISLSIPWSIGRIMDLANKGEGQISLFGLDPAAFYSGFGALLMLGAACNFGRVIILRIVGERIVARLRARLFKRTMVQNAEFFDANRVGDLISRLGVDTTIVGKSITQNLSDGLRALVAGSAGIVMMTWTSPHLTSVLFVMLPPVAIAATFFGRAIRNLSRRVQKNLGTLTKIAEERLGNVKTAQAFVGEAPEVGRYSKQVRKIFELGKKDALLNASFFGVTGFLGNMTVLALLYVGGGMVQSGAISVGQLSSFLLYAGYAGSSMFGLSGFYTELMKGSGAASRIFELQDREPSTYPSVGNPVKSARGPIEFNQVKFSYPTRPAVTIFEDLTFKIGQGSNIAIVAPSGAGKSTVAQLLLRFYTPNSGSITINGKDISTMNAQQLRRKIGYVGQEPVLFSGTVAENIAYGRPHAPRADIIAAARKANCHFISDFVSVPTFLDYLDSLVVTKII